MCEHKVREFVLFQDIDLIVFCSKNGLQALAAAKRVHSDGRLKHVLKAIFLSFVFILCICSLFFICKGFAQLYIIGVIYKDQCVICVWSLLSSKTTEMYKKLIGILRQKCPKLTVESSVHYDRL
jgi:hypothetical protein